LGENKRIKKRLMRTIPLSTIVFGGLLGLLLAYIYPFGWYYSILPPALLVFLYLTLYHAQTVFICLAFFTPLSINIEEYTNGFGLFIPTEPILFGLMLFFLAYKLTTSAAFWHSYRHPLYIILFLYLSWLVITSIPSSSPMVSFKALFSKLWFIVPCFFFSPIFLYNWRSIRQFFWFFTLGITIVIIYTIINHAGYNFGEKESHWVMSPFYKDHTIYGAAIALALPFPIMLFLSKHQSPLNAAVLGALFIIIVAGLYFSYTRAAWLSVLGAGAILLLVYYKINIRWVIAATIIGAFVFLKFGDAIQMELARNKVEHTTESFDDRLKSAANVTTDASNLERLNRWACALEMFKERPFVGFGLGT